MNRFRTVVIALAALLGVMSFAPSFGQGLELPGVGGRSRKTVDEGPKVRVSAAAQRDKVGAGEPTAVAVALQFAKGWHAWPAKVQNVLPANIDEFAVHTSAELKDRPAWVAAVGAVQWPTPRPGEVADIDNPGKTVTVPLYQDRALLFIPLLIAKDAPTGPVSLTITVGYQICDETQCLAPEETDVSVSFEIVAAGAGSAPATAGDFAAFDVTAADTLKPDAAPPKVNHAVPPAERSSDGSTFFGFSLAKLAGPGGFVLLALFGMLGGFFLNLTPCVLPVIPIKVLTLTKYAGSPGRSLVLGIWMSLGVIAFWLALGIPAAFVTAFADPSRLFGIWWLTAGIGLLIGAMGVGMLGVFSLNLPQAVYMVNPEAESAFGSFLFGVMTSVLGLPCFGFVAGALLGATPTFGAIGTIVVFGSIGVGMALPYFVLAARPSLLKSLPKTGPGSALVKQVMGLLLLAAACYFVGSGLVALVQDYPYLAKRLHWWAAAIFATVAGLWLIIRTFAITKRPGPRIAFTLLALLFAAGGIGAAWDETRQAKHNHEQLQAAIDKAGDTGALVTGTWIDYSEPLVKRALAEKKTVVMDFTAEWCLNCKALKAAVLSVAPVKPFMESNGVVMVRVDLTSTRAPGWDKLRSFGQTGIPLLVIQGPGLKEPWMSNAYTPDQVLRALEAAMNAPAS
jgi:thiol:disulfide interchange protein DsbD